MNGGACDSSPTGCVVADSTDKSKCIQCGKDQFVEDTGATCSNWMTDPDYGNVKLINLDTSTCQPGYHFGTNQCCPPKTYYSNLKNTPCVDIPDPNCAYADDDGKC